MIDAPGVKLQQLLLQFYSFLLDFQLLLFQFKLRRLLAAPGGLNAGHKGVFFKSNCCMRRCLECALFLGIEPVTWRRLLYMCGSRMIGIINWRWSVRRKMGMQVSFQVSRSKTQAVPH